MAKKKEILNQTAKVKDLLDVLTNKVEKFEEAGRKSFYGKKGVPAYQIRKLKLSLINALADFDVEELIEDVEA